MITWQIIIILFLAFALIRTWLNHPPGKHWGAFKQFLFLWFVSALPIIYYVSFSKVDKNTNFNSDYFIGALDRLISPGEAFVYVASYLSPVLYSFYRTICDIRDQGLPTSLKEITNHNRGFELIAILAFVTLLFTASIYSYVKSDAEGFKETILFLFMGKSALYIYSASLLMWYTAILSDAPSRTDINQERGKETKALMKKFSERMTGRGTNDG